MASRLTLTWDVLKFFLDFLNQTITNRLTLTWDVLKYYNLLTVP